MRADGHDRGPEVHPGRQRLRVHGPSEDEDGDRREKSEGRRRRGRRLEAAQGSEHGPALRLGKSADFVLDEPARADEEKNDHALREERQQDGRNGVGDVPRDEEAGGGVRGLQMGRQGKTLDGGQEEAGQSEHGACEKRDRIGQSVTTRRGLAGGDP